MKRGIKGYEEMSHAGTPIMRELYWILLMLVYPRNHGDSTYEKSTVAPAPATTSNPKESDEC